MIKIFRDMIQYPNTSNTETQFACLIYKPLAPSVYSIVFLISYGRFHLNYFEQRFISTSLVPTVRIFGTKTIN